MIFNRLLAQTQDQILNELSPNLPDSPSTDPARIFNAVLAVITTLAILFMVIAAFRYTISQGDPQATAQAKNGIIYSIIGLVVAAMAFIIVRFVIGLS